MPTLTTTRTYVDAAVLTKQELDDAFTSIETFVNTTKLDNTNIQSGGIATANIAAAAITNSLMAANSVGTSQLIDANVTAAKLATGAAAGNLDAGSITSTMLSATSVTTAKIAANAVTAAQMANATITGTQLASSINLPGKAAQEASLNLVVSNTNASSTSLAILRGGFLAAGTVNVGEGFTVTRLSAGRYNVSWSASFADAPVVTATSYFMGGTAVIIDILTPGSTTFMSVACYDITGALIDANVYFTAIGQRI